MFPSARKHLNLAFYLLVILVLLVTVSLACNGGAADTTTPTSPTTTSPAATTTFTSPTTIVSYQGLPLAVFNSDDFSGSGNCAICHTGMKDENGKDVSIDSDWRSTMMANAAKDPYWQAKVFTEVYHAPALKEVIEDTCATCHMPMARTQAQVDGTPSLMFDDGFLSEGNALYNAAMDGNSCTLCHQIQSAGLGTDDSFAGKYQIDTSTEPPDRIIFGPFTDQMGGVMKNTSGFIPIQGEHITQAAMCATCHTVITPFVDEDGNIKGTFPEQTPFLEWRNSQYSIDTPCQSCHMPAAAGDVKIASMPGNTEPRSPFGQHFFVGGNTMMLKILRNNGEDIGVSASSANFNDTIDLTLEQLQDNGAGIIISNAVWDGSSLEITLDINNQAGHKYPTGFPSRRSWIHLKVTDPSGNVIFESGKPNVDGTISGNAADDDPSSFEPHYDIITENDQVQIYESIMQTYESDVTYTLLRAASYVKDNRLLPAGFDKNTSESRIAVVGAAAGDDNFVGGSDQITYIIPASGNYNQLTIQVELLYQSISHNLAQIVFEVEGDLNDIFEAYFAAADKLPVVVNTSTRLVQ